MLIEIILVAAAVLTGLVWAADTWFWRKKRVAEDEPVIVDYARSFFPVILIVLVIRSFLYEPFRIPSDSMMPTLLSGDFIFVNKYTYGLRLPISNTELLSFREPDRGDVVVFRQPNNTDTNFIKRLVGLPGDSIEYRNKQLFINGEAAEQDINGAYEGPGENIPEGRYRPKLAEERLLGVDHQILLSPARPPDNFRTRVPDGHYFVMGDNRDNSRDSRFPEVGFVPHENLVGKAVRIWMNWNIPHAAPLWTRVGDRIQ